MQVNSNYGVPTAAELAHAQAYWAKVKAQIVAKRTAESAASAKR